MIAGREQRRIQGPVTGSDPARREFFFHKTILPTKFAREVQMQLSTNFVVDFVSLLTQHIHTRIYQLKVTIIIISNWSRTSTFLV